MIELPIICGPTASGKTTAAIKLFKDNYEAISADSMQVYKYMNIGTACPTKEETKILPHFLIDFISPEDVYSAGNFYKDSLEIINKNTDKKKVIIGGTGLYIKTLLNGFFDGPKSDENLRKLLTEEEKKNKGILHKKLTKMDPESAERINKSDITRIIRAIEVKKLTGKSIIELRNSTTKKPNIKFRIAGIIRDRDDLADRIKSRIDNMIKTGFIDEVKWLVDNGYKDSVAVKNVLGYDLCIKYLNGICTYEQFYDEIISKTKAFARRQIMLFKRIKKLVWFHSEDLEGLKNFFKL